MIKFALAGRRAGAFQFALPVGADWNSAKHPRADLLYEGRYGLRIRKSYKYFNNAVDESVRNVYSILMCQKRGGT